MARFDLYRVDGWRIPLMVDVQAEHLEQLATRTVIPLRPVERSFGMRIPRLQPLLQLPAGGHVLETQDLGTLPRSAIGRPVGNIAEHRDNITAAIDFLFQGF